MPQALLSVTAPVEPSVPLDELAACVQALDPATRALLDLSVRRGVRDDQMAPILRTDPFHLAWRRARALEKIGQAIGGAPLGEVRMALEALPREAWGLPLAGQPALPAGGSAVGAELVPAAGAATAGTLARLDAFATTAPGLRSALADLGRAVAAKAVRLVVWRRRGAV